MQIERFESGTGPVLDFLKRAVELRVQHYFPDLAHSSKVVISHRGQPQIRKHSVLFEMSVLDPSAGKTKGLFVKVIKGADGETTQKVYQTMVELHSLFSELTEELNVVRPLDCLVELPAIVTEQVEGEDLRARLGRNGRLASYEGIMRNCGRFLSCYHQSLGHMAWREDYRGEFLAQCQAYLGGLADHGVEKNRRERILAAFEGSMSKLAGGVRLCVTAKDFHVGNIMVRGSRIYWVDVTEPRAKTIYDDLAAFLNSLTLLYWGRPWFLFHLVPPPVLGQRFLQGYSSGGTSTRLVSLFCAKHLCFRWQSILDSLDARGRAGRSLFYLGPVRMRIDQFFYRQTLKHLEASLAS